MKAAVWGAEKEKPQICATLSSVECALLPHVVYLPTLWPTIFFSFIHINIIPKPQTKTPEILFLQIFFLCKHIEEWKFFLCTSVLTIPVSDSRVVISSLGMKEGKYWGEREEKSDLACLCHAGANIFFIEKQQYNCSN